MMKTMPSTQPTARQARFQNVAIVYRFLPQYRREFYERLRHLLSDEGITLSLFVGNGDASDRAKGDLIQLDWAEEFENRIFRLLGKVAYWQPILGRVADKDLVIVEQASRLLVNYMLQARQYVGGPPVALWGHGRNFQAKSSDRVGEWVKRVASTRAHWWFAYNTRSAEVVSSIGFPSQRITVVQNAIDTVSISAAVAEAKEGDIASLRRKYGVSSENTGVFIGGLYEEKCLGFLFEAASRVRTNVKDFELIVAGDGVLRRDVESMAHQFPWLHYVGPRFGREKAELLSLGAVFLMPGLVGLAVLDAFAAGVPLVTTNVPFHSPEIEYLEHGINGVMTTHDVEAYARAVEALLRDSRQRLRLSDAAQTSSRRYTVENMASNFARGIVHALEAKEEG